MFSLVKFLQSSLEKLKRNKGLWFTTITTISIIGIVISMYVVMTMTSNVSNKVYESMSKDFKTFATNYVEEKQKEFRKMILLLSVDEKILQDIEENSVESIEAFEETVNGKFEQNGITNYSVTLYATTDNTRTLRNSVVSVINSKNSMYGIEVMSDGVFNVYLQPLIKDDRVYGVLEIKESIHNFRKTFEDNGLEYVFILDRKMLQQISIEAKSGRYRDMIGEYMVEQTFYDTKFTASLPEITDAEVEKLFDQEYIIDGLYFRTYKTITDINGADIGMMVIGEVIDKEGGFVNLADDMTKTVTTVALGLVISIILFMF